MEKHITEAIDAIKKENEISKEMQKSLKDFRNNQKNFQYDYEEDFYEPTQHREYINEDNKRPSLDNLFRL